MSPTPEDTPKVYHGVHHSQGSHGVWQTWRENYELSHPGMSNVPTTVIKSVSQYFNTRYETSYVAMLLAKSVKLGVNARLNIIWSQRRHVVYQPIKSKIGPSIISCGSEEGIFKRH